jgi:hypothetical protein
MGQRSRRIAETNIMLARELRRTWTELGWLWKQVCEVIEEASA